MKTKKKRPPENKRKSNGQFAKGNKLGHRFAPGVSGNPGGRPKIKVVSEAARALLASPVPGDKYGRTFAEAIVQTLGVQAVAGNISAASELTDRAEGRAPMAVQISEANDPLTELIAEMKKVSASLPPVEDPPEEPEREG